MSKYFKILVAMAAIVIFATSFSGTTEAQLLRCRQGCGLFQARLVPHFGCSRCQPRCVVSPQSCDPCREETSYRCANCHVYFDGSEWHIDVDCEGACVCNVPHQLSEREGQMTTPVACDTQGQGMNELRLEIQNGPTIDFSVDDPGTDTTKTYRIHFNDPRHGPSTISYELRYVAGVWK